MYEYFHAYGKVGIVSTILDHHLDLKLLVSYVDAFSPIYFPYINIYFPYIDVYIYGGILQTHTYISIIKEMIQNFMTFTMGAENTGHFPHLSDGWSSCETKLVHLAPSDTGGGHLAPLIVQKTRCHPESSLDVLMWFCSFCNYEVTWGRGVFSLGDEIDVSKM